MVSVSGALVLAMVCFTVINQAAGNKQGARWQSATDEKKAEMWSAANKTVPVGPMWNSWELTPSMATKAGVTLPPALHFVHVEAQRGVSRPARVPEIPARKDYALEELQTELRS